MGLELLDPCQGYGWDEGNAEKNRIRHQVKCNEWGVFLTDR